MGVDNFGALTDHFGIESATLVLVDSSLTPVAETVERAEDQNADYADEEKHGQNAARDLAEATCTYALVSGTLNINTLILGEAPAAGTIVSGTDIVTANGAWPMITLTGMINTETVVAPVLPVGALNTWTITDSVVLVGAKRAQLFDFAVDAGCRLTGSTYNAAVDIANQADGLGEIVAHGVSGGVVTQSGDLTRITAACAWTPGITWLETQQPGATEPQANFHTATFSAEKILARDITP